MCTALITVWKDGVVQTQNGKPLAGLYFSTGQPFAECDKMHEKMRGVLAQCKVEYDRVSLIPESFNATCIGCEFSREC